MDNAQRRSARPPKMWLSPRHLPLWRVNGATPTSVAISRELSQPSSGKRAQHRAGNRPDPGHALKHGDPLGGLLLERALDRMFDGGFFPLQPAHHGPDALADRTIASLLMAIALGRDHRDQLLAAAQQILQFLIRLAQRRGGRRLKLLAEAPQPLRVEPVGFGQLPAGLSKMIGVTRIDACDRDARGPQRKPGRLLISTPSLQHHQLGLQRRQPLDQLLQSLLVVADSKGGALPAATSRRFFATSIPTTIVVWLLALTHRFRSPTPALRNPGSPLRPQPLSAVWTELVVARRSCSPTDWSILGVADLPRPTPSWAITSPPLNIQGWAAQFMRWLHA